MARSTGLKLVLTGLMLLGACSFSLVQANESPTDRVVSVSLAELPREGAETYRLILQGGPFRHEKDGVVFGNRERLLPAHKRGYYREYTVTTPGARDRGARRIVCGGPPKTPDSCYYSADHYASFRVIVP
jgi:ribonuclease T1